MAEWSLPDLDCPINQFQYAGYPCRPPEPQPRGAPGPPPAQPCQPAPAAAPDMALHFTPQLHYGSSAPPPAKGENPREVRNRAEKMRRDRLNQSVAELAMMVPPVVAARRKIDKTTVLRLTAHYLRAHQYVFGDSIGQTAQPFNPSSMLKVLSMFNGFLITTTYRGIVVVVSQNVNQYLGYSELDLLGQNLLTITHEGDRAMLRDQLIPRTQTLGPNGELIIPDEPDAKRKVEEALASETRRFIIRLKKLGQRSEPSQYVTCHVEGSLRKSDRACRGYGRCCQIVRRARARSENPCSSGNDIVFIGIVRPTSETFINESALESYRMEYRTRHSIDGEIIQCESRIAIVTGYMTHEVSGVNAMNFMHRDDVRWVIIALREMYDQHRLFGESCYRLITKNGQFIYMRTRGCLDVDRESRAVTSFVCTNTVVDEEEGKQLIKLMKRKFRLLVNNNEGPAIEEIDDAQDDADQNSDQPVPVEDPRRLEQVILHLVTNLPSPSPHESEDESFASSSPDRKSMSPHRLTIIPPTKERIVRSIEKIYSVINIAQRDSSHEGSNDDQSSGAGSSHTTPQYVPALEMNSVCAAQSTQIVPYRSAHVSDYVEAPDSSLALPTVPDGCLALPPVPERCLAVPTAADRSLALPKPPDRSLSLPTAADRSLAQPKPPDRSLDQPTAYNISENDFDADEILNAVASSDFGCFDNTEGGFTNLESLFANLSQDGNETFNEQQIADFSGCQYNGAESALSLLVPRYAEESNMLQALPTSSSSNYSCGTKRHNDFEDFEMACKKKITESEFSRENQTTTDMESPLDCFFDESIFDSDQIESAISLMEFGDQSFPDLLVSSDVTTILDQIEMEAEQERIRELELSLSEYE
ncbi:hypothetical protein PYW07_000309 [Mythimna separata]|uniref:Uncharacterized protein n=1 Tax=Mythimna separata TaxID=271217 RepID=A0AAD7Z3Y2_MYTSE|nr:hypothetical protein PYW07_000309 [Mythimna separata]